MDAIPPEYFIDDTKDEIKEIGDENKNCNDETAEVTVPLLQHFSELCNV